MEVQSEQELAHSLARGDPAAWQAVYDAHAPGVWRYVARLLGSNSADVSDVVQDTLLCAARSAKQFDPARGTIWLWLCGIARRQAALHYRKRGQVERLKTAVAVLLERDGEFLSHGSRQTLPPAELLASRELAALVRETLLQLPENYGALLAARYLDEEDIEQLARRAGCSNQALRARLTRARDAFREVFAKFLDLPAELSR